MQMKRAFFGRLSWTFASVASLAPVALVAVIAASILAIGADADARSLRPFWIPAAVAPEPGACRYESESLFPMMKKDSDRAGAYSSYSIGAGCNVYDWAGFDFEVGLDWRESSDVRANGLVEPAQLFARATYGAARGRTANDGSGEGDGSTADPSGWSAAIGIDDVGFAAGHNDFNVAYAAIQHRAGQIELEIGGYAGSDALKTGAGEKDATGAMAALRRYWGRGALGLEWRSGRNRDGYGLAGIRVQFDETIAATIGYAIANDRENMRDWLLVRLTLSQ